jgi:DNA-binding MarR family transcriptional regulator
MEIQQMRAFLAVASGGGYSRAAEAVHRTQPAVTASVKALERELGIALFERRGRRAALTPAGEALVAEAGPALDQWEGLADRLKERLSGEAQGLLRIGAGEAAVLYLAARHFEGVSKETSEGSNRSPPPAGGGNAPHVESGGTGPGRPVAHRRARLGDLPAVPGLSPGGGVRQGSTPSPGAERSSYLNWLGILFYFPVPSRSPAFWWKRP